MRLARPMYESLPAVYAAIGAWAALISYLESEGAMAGLAFVIAVTAEIAAMTLYLRRRGDRELRREYRGDELRWPTEDQMR